MKKQLITPMISVIIFLFMISSLKTQNYTVARKYQRSDLQINREDSAVAKVEKLVEEAAEMIAYHGREVIQEKFSDLNFTQGYDMFALDMDGYVIAFSKNENLIGQNILNSIDPKGGYYINSYINLLSEQDMGWSQYHKYSNADENKPIRVFLMKIDDDLFIGCEIYAEK